VKIDIKYKPHYFEISKCSLVQCESKNL